jgi:hypothetical protein
VKIIFAECDRDVNAQDIYGRVPMYYALGAESFEEMARILVFLLAHGAEVAEDGRGNSVLLSAAVVVPRMPVKVAQLIAERATERQLIEARGHAQDADNTAVVALIEACIARFRAGQKRRSGFSDGH